MVARQQGCLRLPALPKEPHNATVRIRNEFIPELRELRDSYAHEARRAIERKAKVATFRAGLADELTANPKLARDLDAKVLAYLDLLIDLRAKGSTY